MAIRTLTLAAVAAVVTTLAGTAGAHTAQPKNTASSPTSALTTVRTVVRITDQAPAVEARAGGTLAGHPVYASYSDRRRHIAATYLDGKLVQDTVGTTLYAASGGCFRREHLHKFAGLAALGDTLLPQPGRGERVSYTLKGRSLRWREPAAKQHGSEHGIVDFDARHRIVSTHTAAYTDGHARVAAATVELTYPPGLPRSVPEHAPRPICAAR